MLVLSKTWFPVYCSITIVSIIGIRLKWKDWSIIPENTLSGTHQSFENITVALVCKIHHTDERVLRENLLRTYKMYVNPELYPLVIVLDDKSDESHRMAEELRQEYDVRIVYHSYFSSEKRLEEHEETESQWAMLYLDGFFDSDVNVIGYLNPDSVFISFLTHESIFGLNSRIKVGAVPFDGSNSLPPNYKSFDYMNAEGLPLYFYTSTLVQIRQSLRESFKADSIDPELLQLPDTPIAIFNLMYTTAFKVEPRKYELILPNTKESHKITVASNYKEDVDTLSGCCYSFLINCTSHKYQNAFDILKFVHVRTEWDNREQLVEDYYRIVQNYVKNLKPQLRKRMTTACKMNSKFSAQTI